MTRRYTYMCTLSPSYMLMRLALTQMSAKKPVTEILRIVEKSSTSLPPFPAQIFDVSNLKLHVLNQAKMSSSEVGCNEIVPSGTCSATGNGLSQVAVLWDMENVSPRVINPIMQHLAEQGFYASIRWAFGDIEAQCVAQRKKGLVLYRDTCFKHAFKVKPSPAYVSGKNTADIEMVVAAMDLSVKHQQIEGFVLISSDSDFTPLAIHLREHNKIVLGYGSIDTVKSFVHACTKFIYIERLQNYDAESVHSISRDTEEEERVDEQTGSRRESLETEKFAEAAKKATVDSSHFDQIFLQDAAQAKTKKKKSK